MEATSNTLTPVHLLRHSFRPSEQLGLALDTFYPEESHRGRSFAEIKTLGMMTLNAHKHANYEYSLALIEARKAIEQSKGRSLEVAPEVGIRRIGEKTIDVLMGLQDKSALYFLNRTTRKFIPDANEAYDDVDLNYSLFARIRSSVPISEEFEVEAVERYAANYEKLGSKHLLNVIPQSITGMDQYMPISSLK